MNGSDSFPVFYFLVGLPAAVQMIIEGLSIKPYSAFALDVFKVLLIQRWISSSIVI